MVLLNAFLIRYDHDITYCLAEVLMEKDVVNLGFVVTRAVCDEVRVPLLKPGVAYTQVVSQGKLQDRHTLSISNAEALPTVDFIEAIIVSTNMTVPVPSDTSISDAGTLATVLLFNFRQSNLRSIDGKKGEYRTANDKLQLENSVGDTLDFEYLVYLTLSQQYPNSTQS